MLLSLLVGLVAIVLVLVFFAAAAGGCILLTAVLWVGIESLFGFLVGE